MPKPLSSSTPVAKTNDNFVVAFCGRDLDPDYTAQGIYLKFRVKFDQETVKTALKSL